MPVLQFGDQTRPVGPGVLTVGSAPEAAWRVTGHDLALIHAVIVPERAGRTLISAGGPGAVVYVNGTALEGRAQHVLAHGDRIRLGVADFTFRQHARARGAGESAFLYDRHRDRLYRLDSPTTTIGRDVGCSIFIQDPEVSRGHAQVTRLAESEGGDGGYVVASKSVTLLNGDRLTAPSPLNEGDELTIGRTRLRFSWDAPRGVSPVAEAALKPVGAERAAKFQTTYLSTLDAREMVQRRNLHRWVDPQRLAVFLAAAIGVALIVGFARGARPRAPLPAGRGGIESPIGATSVR
jgi:pSer/pThr/pTyr-binding forkhead associated (FHA) protein